MIDVFVHRRCIRKLERSVFAAGRNEIGGVLAAKQVDDGCFLIVDLSVQSDGTEANFEREPIQHRKFISRFHDRVGNKPDQYNYLGEWHSHPNYPATPSEMDLLQMQELVEDHEQQSSFLVLMIVKLGLDGELRGSAHGFRPKLPPVRARLHGIEEWASQDSGRPVTFVSSKVEGV